MTAVQQAVAPDFAVSLKCPSQLHLRETGELNRSVLMMCTTCNSNTQEIWGPVPRPPVLTQIRIGNWIALEECPQCKQLWTKAPFEPYAAFEYMAKWPLGITDWNRIHDGDDARTLHEWLINEIRRLYRNASKEIRDGIESHEQRSYGHYNLTISLDVNPILMKTE